MISFPYNFTDTAYIPEPSTYFEKINEQFAYLCQIMMTVCVDLFKDILLYYFTPKELGTVLRGTLHYFKSILNFDQHTFLEYDILVPTHERRRDREISPITKDLSLLYILIRFICNIPPPQTGWGCRPENDDKSLAGCIERIIILWKTILDHAEETKETLKTDFKYILENLRTNISEIQKMVFEKDSYAHAVDEIFSPDIKLSKRYIHDFKKLSSKNNYKWYFPYIRIVICFT